MRISCSKAASPLAILALAGLAACGSSGSGDATPPVTQAIAISLAGSSLSVVQGQSNTVNITVTRTGGFTGAVSLSLENAPTGVTGTFTPQSLTGTTASSTLLVTSAANAATATTNVTVRATGTGVTAQTASFALTVTAAPTGGYTISLSQNSLTLLQGTSGNVTVNVNRNAPFSGAVSVAASGLPANVTVSPSPANVTTANAQLTFTVGSGVAAGNYPITLRGTATGVPDQQATLTLQVAAASGGTSVTVAFCQADPPIWVGSQSETGPWITATSGASNSYTFNINNRGGFAAAFNAVGGGYRIEITYGTATELANSGTQCTTPAGTKIVNGTVASLAAAESAYVSLGAAEGGRRGPGAFQLFDVGEGQLDLIALRYAVTVGSATPTKGIFRHNVTQAGGSTVPALDFAAAEAFDPVSANLAISNLGSDDPFVLAYMATSNGGTNAYYFGGLFGGGATQPWYGVPEAKLSTGDLHNVLTYGINQNGDQFRVVYLWARQVTNRTITLGPAVSAPAISVAGTTPYVRHRAQFTRQPEYAQGALIEYDQSSQSSPASFRTLSIQASAAYLGGNPTTWDLTTPDLSGASGFLAIWGPQSSAATSYFIGGIGGTGDINAPPADGTILSIGFRAGNAPSSEAPPSALGQRAPGRQLPLALPRLRRAVRR